MTGPGPETRVSGRLISPGLGTEAVVQADDLLVNNLGRRRCWRRLNDLFWRLVRWI